MCVQTSAASHPAGIGCTQARTVSVVEKTREGERLAWSFVAEEALDVDIEQQDLIELVGVLLENAAKWAESRVDIRVRRDGEEAETTIADDGAGLSSEQIARLGTRGQRLDETKKGSGLGLAIAGEIVELNGGRLGFECSPGTGLLVRLRLRVARARP